MTKGYICIKKLIEQDSFSQSLTALHHGKSKYHHMKHSVEDCEMWRNIHGSLHQHIPEDVKAY